MNYLCKYFNLSCSTKCLKTLSYLIEHRFTIEEQNYLNKCIEDKVDLFSIELMLRWRNKDNIMSFVFLRLSALAESIPENQSLYINAKPLTLFQVFVFLSTTVINLLLLKIKSKFVYQNLINEYPNV